MDIKEAFRPRPYELFSTKNTFECCCKGEILAKSEQLKKDCAYYGEMHDMGAWEPWCMLKSNSITEKDNCLNCNFFENRYSNIEM